MLQCQPPKNLKDQLQGIPDDIEPKLAILLHTYIKVFDIPTGLPPERNQTHAINLVQGADPVKVRPYRYPHSHKNQIEMMIQEMLKEGMIQPSNRPFSSPIVLVKQKDGN